MRPQHAKDAIAPQTGNGKHAKPIQPHDFKHPHAGLNCRCFKRCEICELPEQMCVARYAPNDFERQRVRFRYSELSETDSP